MDRRDSVFAALLKKEAVPLASFVLALVGDRHVADDLFQSACLELWRIRRTFVPGTNFGAWARTVARYQVLQYWRKSGRESVSFSSEAVERIEAAYNSPQEEDTIKGLRGALEKCMESLTLEERQLLRERYNHGTSLKTLARRSGRTEAGLKMALMRLRKKLAQCVNARMDGKESPHGERTP